MKRTLQQAIELIEQKKENARNSQIATQNEMKKLTPDKLVDASAKMMRLQGEYNMAEDILNILKTVEIGCKDEIKLTQEAWDTMSYIQERVDANIEEIVSGIKCEYDAKVEKVPNAYDKGNLMMMRLQITPIVWEANIKMQYVQKVVHDEE